jgi:hypothetical protein
LMACAADWAPSYDSSESWQLAQCSNKIEATSLVNVGAPTPAEENASATIASTKLAGRRSIVNSP